MARALTLDDPLTSRPGRRPPRVGLFIPCYVDQLYPRVGLATLEILEACGLTVEFPEDQTCCGQPMANTGCTRETRPLAEKFLRVFGGYDYVVAPSGSCVAMVRLHYEEYLHDRPGFEELKRKTYELCEFLTDIVRVRAVEGSFPHTVGLHQSCHGLRELRLGRPSELMAPAYNKPRQLLALLDGIRFAELTRSDECCGFGGTFAVNEEAVSCMMGQNRLADHEKAGTEVLTANDMSCLMHLEGLLRRAGRAAGPAPVKPGAWPPRVMHVAEILAGDPV